MYTTPLNSVEDIYRKRQLCW